MTNYVWPLMKDTLTFCDRLKLAKFVLTSNKFTQGPKVAEFEEAWSKWIAPERGACPYSLYVTSGSTANFLLVDAAMELYNIPRGSKVIVPAVTWVTNINPIIQLGLKPIFVDVNFDDFSFCEDSFKLAVMHHGGDIKMVFTTHLLGFPAPVEKFKKLLPYAIFIDDVCESHGCKDENGVKIGADSTGATFSFYFGHHMSTIEGGMITTNNYQLYDLMKMKRSHGLARNSDNFASYASQHPDIDSQFLFMNAGYNFRNTELGAVLGLAQLPRLDKYIDNRKRRYAEFVTMLNHTNRFKPLKANPGNSSFCLPFVAKHVSTKEKLIEMFKEEGIEYRPIVGGNLLRQPYLLSKGYDFFTIEGNANLIHTNGVYIGNNQFVNEHDMDVLEMILEDLLK